PVHHEYSIRSNSIHRSNHSAKDSATTTRKHGCSGSLAGPCCSWSSVTIRPSLPRGEFMQYVSSSPVQVWPKMKYWASDQALPISRLWRNSTSVSGSLRSTHLIDSRG